MNDEARLMGQSVTETVWIEDLQTGVVCKHPIVDEAGVLLLGANTALTQAVIDGLTDRGIESLEVDPRDALALRGKGSSASKKPQQFRGRKASSDQGWNSGDSFKERLVDRFSEPLDPKRGEALKAGLLAAKKQISEVQQMLVQRNQRTAKAIERVADVFANFLLDDFDQTVGDIGNADTLIDLADRSIKLASLGMAVGVELGLDGAAVCEIGTTGLLHDIGLYSMNPRFKVPGVQWNEDEFWEYQKHPIVAQHQLSEVQEIPHQVCIAVEQVHEQFDGTGFPRGMKGQRIHPYARILNVVDSYLQLILPNQQRPGVVPHDAVGILLHQARHGMFEPQVIRAFLQTESLFPLGSHVELTNGAKARVIRRPRDGYTAPVIEIEPGERIDLSESDLSISRPATDDAIDQVRVSQDQMHDPQWSPVSSFVVN